MKFSTRSRYGLRAMVELAVNYSTDEPTPLSLVAEKQELSEGYLEQLMTFLRKGGLVRSVRGAQGGYLLSRPPGQITAGDIIRCLEGPLSPTDCVNEDGPDPCERAEICVTRGLWEKVRIAIADVLDSVTLEELSKNAEEIRRSRESYMYYL
ncbi:MAG: Rrf2 family transcriptional regulator [Firmicutes bacterium]|nr:Rrf2 family transcriptional regulator [Bacillota bacterium]